MIFNRKYIKIDVNSNNPLANKVPNAHISLVEYYVVNSDEGNQLNGKFNSSNDLGLFTLRNRILNFINSNNISFEPKSLVKMGTSDWLGTQMQMKRNGVDQSFDFLTEWIIDNMYNILNSQEHISSRSIVKLNSGTFNWIRRFGGENQIVTNDSTWYMHEFRNNSGTPKMYVKIYYPANPHISIASADDFTMGVTPGGFNQGVNASQIVGGGSTDYKPIQNNLFKLA